MNYLERMEAAIRDYYASVRTGETSAKKCQEAYATIEELCHFMIQWNVQHLGLKDLDVRAALHARSGSSFVEEVCRLSVACGLRYSGLAEKLKVTAREVNTTVVVSVDGVIVGRIDSDGRFIPNPKGIMDFRTALGWSLISDGGRYWRFRYYDLDRAAKEGLRAVRHSGKNGFYTFLQGVFLYERTSRYGADVYWIEDELLAIAHRELEGVGEL